MIQNHSRTRLEQRGIRLLPAGWTQSRVKYLGKYINGFPFKPEDWGDVGRPILRIQDLNSNTPDPNRFSGQIRDRYLVRPGDILISWSASLGVYRWAGEEAWLNQHIFKVALNERKVRDDYFFWLAEWFIREMELDVHGSTMQHVTADVFGGFPVLLPSIPEQRAIADFLERETAKVDDLIAKKQELMVVLQNQKDAVVGQLVVGRDLNVPKRGSAYSWLGEVPCEWKVLALKRIAKRVVVGIAEASTHAYSDDGISLIRSTNIKPNRLDSQQLLKIEPWFADKNKSKTVLGDDLLTVRSGVNYGDTAVVPKTLAGSQCFTLLVTTLKPDNEPQYYSYYLNSIINRAYFEREAWGAAQANLSVPILQMTPVPVPPPSEQKRIVQELDGRLSNIDRLRASLEETERQLQLLRSALISAAVTGQIDVRNYRPQEAAALCQ